MSRTWQIDPGLLSILVSRLGGNVVVDQADLANVERGATLHCEYSADDTVVRLWVERPPIEGIFRVVR